MTKVLIILQAVLSSVIEKILLIINYWEYQVLRISLIKEKKEGPAIIKK